MKWLRETAQKSHRPCASPGSTFSLSVLICQMGVLIPTPKELLWGKVR